MSSDTHRIRHYHAHVYYDDVSKGAAADLRSAIEANFPGATIGRWHDEPVGPHPCGSYQVAFEPNLFAEITPWLALNRRGLTVFLHPETGDALADHTGHAIWMGGPRALRLEALQ